MRVLKEPDVDLILRFQAAKSRVYKRGVTQTGGHKFHKMSWIDRKWRLKRRRKDD